MHVSVMQYAEKMRDKYLSKPSRVIEIGSYDVNGSVRPLFEPTAEEYVGVDIAKGPTVDVVVKEDESLLDRFDEFDLVISTEMLEHAKDWRKAVSEIKNLSSKYMLVTTRSEGFWYHPYPEDYWRYSLDDFKKIFSDCEILDLTDDWFHPGVMMVAKKPKDFKENDLSDMELFKIEKDK